MDGRKDVFEFIIDGTSGIAPGSVTGKALIAGVCSLGEVGKVYFLGRSSDLTGLLGVGPLVDCLRDVFATAGQDATILAVPVSGQASGYISPAHHLGTGPAASVSGAAGANADAVAEIVAGGALGTATYKLSADGGATWGATTATPANGQIALGATGATLVLGTGNQVAEDTYAVTVRAPVGPVAKVGSGPDITAAGTPKAGAEVVLTVTKAGGRNVGQYQLSTDGGDNFARTRTIPIDGLIACGTTGVTITVPAQDLMLGDTYSFRILPPTPSVSDVIQALALPLERIDPEFIHVVGPSDSVDWAALGTLADDLFSKHRPTFFTCESRLPYDGEDLSDWTSALLDEVSGVAHRFVSVCAAFGEIVDVTGQRKLRNAGGLLVGRIVSIPVMRDIGRVRDQGISQLTIPSTFTEAMQVELEAAGYVTATMYAGLRSAYWGEARTLAEATSDYRTLEILRVVFKGLRLLRVQALKSLKDEAGDWARGANASGITYLQGNLAAALNTMVAAVPQELAAAEIVIPDGQDLVNNGLAVEVTFIGIPIIKKIKLFASYVYAGSAFDPRLASQAD